MSNGEVIIDRERRNFVIKAVTIGATIFTGYKILESVFNNLPSLNDNKPEPLPEPTPPPAKKEKPVRNDVKVIFGTSRDDFLSSMNYVAEYLNKSQKVPIENITMIKPAEFTYENFLKTVKKVGNNVSDTDTLIINPGSDGSAGAGDDGGRLQFKTAYGAEDIPYKTIFEGLKDKTNPKADKLIVIDACYSGVSLKAAEEVDIPNAAVITATTDKALSTAVSTLNALITEHDVFPRIDYNGDGKISVEESYKSFRKFQEDGSVPDFSTSKYKSEGKVIPQILDKYRVTGRMFLID